jgi:4-amino-4-deoxy-L-arabinose transferase-like glycosyltransferase
MSGTSDRRFAAGLAAVALLAIAIRVAAVIGRPDRVPGGDALFYNAASDLLAHGKGFINALHYKWFHQTEPSAAYAPGFTVILAVASLIGFKTYFAHRIWCAILGGLATVVCGLVGREIGGARVGLLAALIVAFFPNIWMSNELEMSETVTPIVVALVLLAVYRFWRAPSVRGGVWMGVALGAAVLTRDELALLGPLVVVPAAALAGSSSWRKRLLYLCGAGLAFVISVGPWIGYNMSRFRDPVFVSTGMGVTLASTDCSQTWYGPDTGFWSFACENQVPTQPGQDESQDSAEATSFAMRYVRSHESRIVIVALARVGRGFAVFHPLQEIGFDSTGEGRPLHWALTGLYAYYAMLPLMLVGAITLRRKGVPLFPLVGVAVSVGVAMVVAFGDTRYRTAFDTCLALVAAVGIDALMSTVEHRRAVATEPLEEILLIPAGGVKSS